MAAPASPWGANPFAQPGKPGAGLFPAAKPAGPTYGTGAGAMGGADLRPQQQQTAAPWATGGAAPSAAPWAMPTPQPAPMPSVFTTPGAPAPGPQAALGGGGLSTSAVMPPEYQEPGIPQMTAPPVAPIPGAPPPVAPPPETGGGSAGPGDAFSPANQPGWVPQQKPVGDMPAAGNNGLLNALGNSNTTFMGGPGAGKMNLAQMLSRGSLRAY